MRRFLLLLGALAQTTMLVTADELAKPASATAVPVIDATVAVIPGGAVSADSGMQGIALNADRSLVYIGEGAKFATYDPLTRSCTGTPPSSQRATGSVGIFDTGSRTRVTDVPLAGGQPVHVELDPSTGRIYVAASPFGVYAFQGTAQVGSLSLDAAPHDLGIDSINGHAVVTNTFNTSQTWVSLIDLASLRVLANTNTGAFGPHKAASDSSRHLVYVTHAEFPNVDVIDTQTGQLLRQIATGLVQGGAQNAIDLSRRRLYTVGAASTNPQGNDGRLVAIDLATERPIGTPLALPLGAHGTRVDPVTGLIWVVLGDNHQISVVDPDTLTERARIPTGHCPYYLDIDPVRRLVYVTNGGDNSISVLDATKVPPAGGLGAASLTYSLDGRTVNLTWSAVSGAISYDVEAGSSTGLADLAVLNTTALGLTATAGPGTYYVRVRARNAAGVSAPSNEVIITVGGCAAPAAPSGLALQSAVGGTVVLTWLASPGEVSSYIVEAGSGPGRSDLANADLGTSATTLTATGVSSGVYYVRMRARNACGVSAPSNEIHITVP